MTVGDRRSDAVPSIARVTHGHLHDRPTKFTEFDVGTPLSKTAGAFENRELNAVVTDGDEYRGVVGRRQLAPSSNHPSAKVGTQAQAGTALRVVARRGDVPHDP